MRTETVKIYSFKELPKKTQQAVLDRHRDWNLDYDWWEWTYEDAKLIGLKIEGFESFPWRVEAVLSTTVEESCRLILKNHGKHCDTHKLAREWRKRVRAERVTQRCLEPAEEWSEPEELVAEYSKALGEIYAEMLEKEYEYQSSDEAIIESWEANQVEFYEDGRIV